MSSNSEKPIDGPHMEYASTSGPTQAPVKTEKRFNFWTAFGVAVCTSGAVCSLHFAPSISSDNCMTDKHPRRQWEGWTASIAQGISGGGSVGLMWGWVFVSVGITCMACALAEFVRFVCHSS